MGVGHTDDLNRHHLYKRVDENRIKTYADLYP
jgi:hypothetical protein